MARYYYRADLDDQCPEAMAAKARRKAALSAILEQLPDRGKGEIGMGLEDADRFLTECEDREWRTGPLRRGWECQGVQ